jgi:hypothetical protein
MTTKEVEIAMSLYTSTFQKFHPHVMQVDEGFTIKYIDSKRCLIWAVACVIPIVCLLFLCPVLILFLHAVFYGLQSIPFPTWILGYDFFIAIIGMGTVSLKVTLFIKTDKEEE